MEDVASDQLRSYKATAGTTPILTTSNGAPVDSLTASMTAGKSGPIVLQDFVLLDHIAKFDRERIPERVVHAKGAGAFGHFETTTNFMKDVCKADMFSSRGIKTPVAVRFSTVGGESGSADTARDPRGFAIKFYSDEGNWDLVGNNTPIFFIRDPILFPSFIHTQKRNPATHLADCNMFWDFISKRPETTHQVSFLFSDRGIPNGYRHMNGYGSHAFKNVNAKGEATFVKYHFKTDQGIANLDGDEASKIASSDPDYSIRDLYNAIATNRPPSWTMYVQVMTIKQVSSCPFDPFDLTKIWSHVDYPLHEVGRMTLNRNPTNYFSEVEQLAFSPSHMIPGIEPSPDKMLQARLFSYPDTHRHRLQSNYQALPVNAPRNAANNYQRDGTMQVTQNGGDAPNYFPNSFQGPAPIAGKWHASPVQGIVERVETGQDDNFSQVRDFWSQVLSPAQRDRLTTNIAQHMSGVTCPEIQQRALRNFDKVHADFGGSIRRKLLPPSGRPKPIQAAPLNPPRDVLPDCPLGFGRSKL